jgi:hypothetical protein
MRKNALVIAVCLGVPFTIAIPHQSSDKQKEQPQSSMTRCPMADAHSRMNERAEKGMGFSQSTTTHHFLLKPDGGVIQVEVNDIADTANRDNIRMHLKHIAQVFTNGDFDIPMFVHDTLPPGVPEMKRLREKIHYSYEETPTGGRVVIKTPYMDSLVAIHKFLRFQIQQHKTGDPIEIP